MEASAKLAQNVDQMFTVLAQSILQRFQSAPDSDKDETVELTDAEEVVLKRSKCCR